MSWARTSGEIVKVAQQEDTRFHLVVILTRTGIQLEIFTENMDFTRPRLYLGAPNQIFIIFFFESCNQPGIIIHTRYRRPLPISGTARPSRRRSTVPSASLRSPR